MQPKGIIFDKDNTLIDLEVFGREPSECLAREIAEKYGGPVGISKSLPDSGCSERLVRKLLAAIGYRDGRLIPESPIVAGTNTDVAEACERVLLEAGIPTDSGFRERVKKRFSELSVKLGTVVGLASPALYRALHRQGIRLAVATSDNYEPCMRCLTELGIEKHFDMILSADRVNHPKPAPDMARAFCDAFSLNPWEVWMVGDSVNDMRFAEKAGLIGIYFSKEDGPLPPGAQRKIARLEELQKLIFI